MCFRGIGNFEIIKPIPGVGCRIKKDYFQVTKQITRNISFHLIIFVIENIAIMYMFLFKLTGKIYYRRLHKESRWALVGLVGLWPRDGFFWRLSTRSKGFAKYIKKPTAIGGNVLGFLWNDGMKSLIYYNRCAMISWCFLSIIASVYLSEWGNWIPRDWSDCYKKIHPKRFIAWRINKL